MQGIFMYMQEAIMDVVCEKGTVIIVIGNETK